MLQPIKPSHIAKSIVILMFKENKFDIFKHHTLHQVYAKVIDNNVDYNQFFVDVHNEFYMENFGLSLLKKEDSAIALKSMLDNLSFVDETFEQISNIRQRMYANISLALYCKISKHDWNKMTYDMEFWRFVEHNIGLLVDFDSHRPGYIKAKEAVLNIYDDRLLCFAFGQLFDEKGSCLEYDLQQKKVVKIKPEIIESINSMLKSSKHFSKTLTREYLKIIKPNDIKIKMVEPRKIFFKLDPDPEYSHPKVVIETWIGEKRQFIKTNDLSLMNDVRLASYTKYIETNNVMYEIVDGIPTKL